MKKSKMCIRDRGMIPSNSIGRTAMTRLRAYAGSEHKHAAQKPAEWNL